MIIPVITGGTGMVDRLFNDMKSMPETFNRFITKRAILGKLHIIRKVLQSES
jgi:hypothetical protein